MQATQELEQEGAPAGSAARLIREVHRNTRKRFSAEDKIRIVLEGFRKEMPGTDLCRREGLSTALYYSWLKDFMEAGKMNLCLLDVEGEAIVVSQFTLAAETRKGNRPSFTDAESPERADAMYQDSCVGLLMLACVMCRVGCSAFTWR